MVVDRKCPICDSNEAEELDKIGFGNEKGNLLPTHYDIVCCTKCGFTYANMKASQEMFDDYYVRLNIYSEAEKIRKIITDANSPYFKHILSIVSGVINKNDSIIDIGCGGGELLGYLKESGYVDLTGLDPDETSIECLQSQGGINAINGSLFGNINENLLHSFDMVISTMVAEHIYDLNSYVRRLLTFVNERGHILVTVPAVEGFPKYLCAKANYFNQEHINYFSAVSMSNLFGKYGYSLENKEVLSNLDSEKVLYLLFKKSNTNLGIKKDEISQKCIREYLDLYSEQEMVLEGKIQRIMTSKKSIVFWGSGQYAKQILNKYPEVLEKLLYFVDNNSMHHGHEIFGKKIFSPIKVANEKEEIVICVCSMKNGEAIKGQINSQGIPFEIVIL